MVWFTSPRTPSLRHPVECYLPCFLKEGDTKFRFAKFDILISAKGGRHCSSFSRRTVLFFFKPFESKMVGRYMGGRGVTINRLTRKATSPHIYLNYCSAYICICNHQKKKSSRRLKATGGRNVEPIGICRLQGVSPLHKKAEVTVCKGNATRDRN